MSAPEILASVGLSTLAGAGGIRFLLRYILLPSQLMGKPSRLDPLRENFLRRHGALCVQSKISSDGVTLDGFEWRNPALTDEPVEKERWVVWSNANGVCYEELLRDGFVPEYCTKLGAHMLLWNYRGVGRSTGSSASGNDLVQDCLAVIQELISRGVPPQNILLHGHSMGGAASCVAAARCKMPVAVLSDRSFSSLNRTIQAHTSRGPLGIVLGGLFASISAVVAVGILEFGFGAQTPTGLATLVPAVAGVVVQSWWLCSHSVPVSKLPAILRPIAIPICVILSALIGFRMLAAAQHSASGRALLFGLLAQCVAIVAAIIGALPKALAVIAVRLGWEIDAAGAWEQITGRKGILYHKRDTMIDYECSSLHKAVGDGNGSVELTAYRGPACHMYGLADGHQSEWQRTVELARSLLDRSNSKM